MKLRRLGRYIDYQGYRLELLLVLSQFKFADGFISLLPMEATSLVLHSTTAHNKTDKLHYNQS